MPIIKRRKNEKWDYVCVFCDDGGDVFCCDGVCLRSFHPIEKLEPENSQCPTLGLTEEEYKFLQPKEVKFICKNCKDKQHQCFACGKLGSSDLSAVPEVFQCMEEKCGKFYHPNCIAELLYPDNNIENFEQEVTCGQRFSCPMHTCRQCKGAEDKHTEKMQFALCRRCPTAYHRKCLPRDISFKKRKDETPQRAWDGIITNQILIYCMKHPIVPELKTPKRDHIKFPDPRTCAATRLKVAPPKEQDTADADELPDHPLSAPSQPLKPAETKPIDSFAAMALFQRPQTSSCGWLDE